MTIRPLSGYFYFVCRDGFRMWVHEEEYYSNSCKIFLEEPNNFIKDLKPLFGFDVKGFSYKLKYVDHWNLGFLQ